MKSTCILIPVPILLQILFGYSCCTLQHILKNHSVITSSKSLGYQVPYPLPVPYEQYRYCSPGFGYFLAGEGGLVEMVQLCVCPAPLHHSVAAYEEAESVLRGVGQRLQDEHVSGFVALRRAVEATRQRLLQLQLTAAKQQPIVGKLGSIKISVGSRSRCSRNYFAGRSRSQNHLFNSGIRLEAARGPE